MLLDVGTRKINAQYVFKILTYTEGNKMASGSVLSLDTKISQYLIQTIPLLRDLINSLSQKYVNINKIKNNNSKRYISSISALDIELDQINMTYCN